MLGIDGRRIEIGKTLCTFAAGATATAVTFSNAFVQTPDVLVVSLLSDTGATYSATGKSKTGFTISVTGSAVPAGDVELHWVAYEKG